MNRNAAHTNLVFEAPNDEPVRGKIVDTSNWTRLERGDSDAYKRIESEEQALLEKRRRIAASGIQLVGRI